ncbi:unnamed protein product [Durusdinium trenchii]
MMYQLPGMRIHQDLIGFNTLLADSPWPRGQKYLSELKDLTLQPDEVTLATAASCGVPWHMGLHLCRWPTTLPTALVSSLEHWSWAVELFVAARSEQLEVDVAFTTALSTTSTNGRQWPLSLHLGAHSSEADLLLLNAQLSAAWMGQRWQHALRLVVAALEQRMPIDDYGCSRVILACEENQKWHCSLNLLVSSHGVFSYSWTDFMSSRLRAGHWSSVLQLGSSLFPSTLTGELGIGELSLLVKSCQTWQKGLQLWHESPQELRQISGCNAAMALVAQQDTSAPHWPVAVELFTLARSGRLQPDELSFSSMPRRWPASVETTLRGLHVAQQPLDEVCLATLLRCGTWRFCLHTFLLGQRLRASPDETCYNACAASLCTSERWRETVELWRGRGGVMSIVSLDAAACCVLRAGCHRPVLHILDRLNLQAERVLSPAARSPAGPAGPAPHDTLTWSTAKESKNA